MKSIYNKIVGTIRISAVLFCLTSCNYLDVIPPAQPEYEDTMKDAQAVLSFAYSCYSGIPRCQPYYFQSFEQSADEIAAPADFNDWQQQVAWGTISPSYYNSWGGDDVTIWIPCYNWLGYVHNFLDLIDKLQPSGVTQEDKEQYKAEMYFLEAYYHFRVLQAFGPCPIITGKISPNISNEQIPGRSHFDYCVDFIVGKLDEAAKVLPPKRDNNYLGRATSTICKALKARVLLYAASPLWNGSFPYPNWKNENYETPGYGQELVSLTEERGKWERALTANLEALEAAREAGYDLFDIATANALAAKHGLELPFVPGKEDDTEENNKFKERVRMFQYLSTANEEDGNKEIIWGQRIAAEDNDGGENVDCRLPSYIGDCNDGQARSGWASLAPTLYAVEHFYTENGKLPEQDMDFWNKTDWYTRFYEGKVNEDNSSRPDLENVKYDIIKLHANREARFYAWIVYDGCQYSPILRDGNPLWINFKNSKTNGYTTNLRNYVGTGYLSKKFIDPKMIYYAAGGGSLKSTATRRPFIRMAELYLNLAECYDALEQPGEALKYLNKIRNRAGFDDLTTGTLDGMDLTDWIRNERFVELYEEGHRYYDLRRWTIAPERLKAGTRYGLNGLTVNPSFEDFNKPTLIDQPFKWDDRLYLLPIWTRSDRDELYSNPQLVQAPGY